MARKEVETGTRPGSQLDDEGGVTGEEVTWGSQFGLGVPGCDLGRLRYVQCREALGMKMVNWVYLRYVLDVNCQSLAIDGYRC
jgi:hypothetical protein